MSDTLQQLAGQALMVDVAGPPAGSESRGVHG